jgi:glycosyltransferase involved in cell wall biosynthesis
MRILILTQYYPPETGAPQNRLSDLAGRLSGSGHQVTVLTALPNYPRGEIFGDYRGRALIEEHCGEIKIIRTWIYASKRKSFCRRLLNYFSFVASSFALGVWKVGRQDVVMVESPPLFLGISGYLLSFCKNAKLVFNVSDLWPESAIAMGMVTNPWIIRASRWLEEFLYKRSVLITGQTQGIVDNIRSRFGDKRVALITNGVDVKAFSLGANGEQKDAIRREFGLEKRFVVGYAGLHGLAQCLETVLRAAALVREHKEILFVFFGDGPEKEKLLRFAKELDLENVRFLPSQPTSRMPQIIQTFDLALVPLKKLELFKGALPSKMFEAMAAAVPLIVTADGEARELLGRAQAGISVEAENPEAMARAVLQLFQDEERLKTFGIRGRQYVMQHYNREKIAKDFERLLIGRDGAKAAPV